MTEPATQALTVPKETRALALQPPDLSAIERVIIAGDLSKLTPDERWAYYQGVCRSLGLNPFTTPFAYLTLQNKMVLYAAKGCAEQLRGIHHLSIRKPQVDISDGLCIVSVTAHHPSGREDSDLGIVPIEGLRGEAKANAIMKAITKAKRRVTLSMLGLGMLDETEVETIPGAQVQAVEIPPRELSAPVNFGTSESIGGQASGQPSPPPSLSPVPTPSTSRPSGNIERISDPADSRWQWFIRLSQVGAIHKVPVPKLELPVTLPQLDAANKGLERGIVDKGGELPEPIDATPPRRRSQEAEWRETTVEEPEQASLV
jgi:hypothetical protein